MCVYCHDLNRSHAINDETKKKKKKGAGVERTVGAGGRSSGLADAVDTRRIEREIASLA